MEYGKLIELLNEYERSRGYEGGWEIKNGIPYFDDELPKTKEYISVLICAKPYGFIKWLVDNDKININEEWDDYEETNLCCNSDFFQLQKRYSYYESLLMLLSISDTPIEDLVSYLK